MKSKTVLILALTLTYGCADKGAKPCDLLTLEEVRQLAPDAQGAEYHSASTSQNKDNDLCLWHDGGEQHVFMLFLYSSPRTSPMELVKSGMPYGARIIEVSGVGDSAAAGFLDDSASSTGALKMFSAQSGSAVIGIRVQGVSGDKSEKFNILKEIASNALSRI